MALPRAAILGCAGPDLTADERAFFRDADPLGFIVFARNIDTPERTRRLIEELRSCVARADAPVLIDQEGGRVARLRPPHWRKAPPASLLGVPSSTSLMPICDIAATIPGVTHLPVASMTVAPAGTARLPTPTIRPSRMSTVAPSTGDAFPVAT